MVLDAPVLPFPPETPHLAASCSPILWTLPTTEPCHWSRPLSLAEPVGAVAHSCSSPTQSLSHDGGATYPCPLPLFVSRSSSTRLSRAEPDRASEGFHAGVLGVTRPPIFPSSLASASSPSVSRLWRSVSPPWGPSSGWPGGVCCADERLKREHRCDVRGESEDSPHRRSSATEAAVSPFSRTNLLLTLQSARRGAILPTPSDPGQLFRKARGRGGDRERETSEAVRRAGWLQTAEDHAPESSRDAHDETRVHEGQEAQKASREAGNRMQEQGDMPCAYWLLRGVEGSDSDQESSPSTASSSPQGQPSSASPSFASAPALASSPYMEGLGSRGVRGGRAGGGWARPAASIGGMFQAGLDRFFRQKILQDDAFCSSVRARGHYGCVNAISFSSDGTLLGSGGDDKRVLLWRVREPRNLPIQEIPTRHQENIFGVMFDSSDQYVLTCGNDGLVMRTSLENPNDTVVRNDVDALRRDPTLPSESRLRLLRTMDAGASFQASFLFSGHHEAIVAMEAGTVETFDFRERDMMGRVITRADASVLSVCVHPVQQFLFAYCCCQKAALVDLRTKEAVCVLKDVLRYARDSGVSGGVRGSFPRCGYRRRSPATHGQQTLLESRSARGRRRRNVSSSSSSLSSSLFSSPSASSSSSSPERAGRQARRVRHHCPARNQPASALSASSPSSLSSPSSPSSSPSSSLSSPSASSSSPDSSSCSSAPPRRRFRSRRSSGRLHTSSGSVAVGVRTADEPETRDASSSDGESHTRVSVQYPPTVPVRPAFLLPASADRPVPPSVTAVTEGPRGALRGEDDAEGSFFPCRESDRRGRDQAHRSPRHEFRYRKKLRRGPDTPASTGDFQAYTSSPGRQEQEQKHQEANRVSSSSAGSASCSSSVLASPGFTILSEGGDRESELRHDVQPASPGPCSPFISQEGEDERGRLEDVPVAPGFVLPMEDVAYAEYEDDGDFSGEDFVCTTRGLSVKKTEAGRTEGNAVPAVRPQNEPRDPSSSLKGGVSAASVLSEALATKPKQARHETDVGGEGDELKERRLDGRKRRKTKQELSPADDTDEELQGSRGAKVPSDSKAEAYVEPDHEFESNGSRTEREAVARHEAAVEEDDRLEQEAASARRARLATRKGRKPFIPVAAASEQTASCTRTRAPVPGRAHDGSRGQDEVCNDLLGVDEETRRGETADGSCGERERAGLQAASMPQTKAEPVDSGDSSRATEAQTCEKGKDNDTAAAPPLSHSLEMTEHNNCPASVNVANRAACRVRNADARKGYISDPDELAGPVPHFDFGPEKRELKRKPTVAGRSCEGRGTADGREDRDGADEDGGRLAVADGWVPASRRRPSSRRRAAEREADEGANCREPADEGRQVKAQERGRREEGQPFHSTGRGREDSRLEVRRVPHLQRQREAQREEKLRERGQRGVPAASSRRQNEGTGLSSSSEDRRDEAGMGGCGAVSGGGPAASEEDGDSTRQASSARNRISASSAARVAPRSRRGPFRRSPPRPARSTRLSEPTRRPRSPPSLLACASDASVRSSERGHDGRQRPDGDEGERRGSHEEATEFLTRRRMAGEEGEREDRSDGGTSSEGTSLASSRASLEQSEASSAEPHARQDEADQSETASPLLSSSEAPSDRDRTQASRRRRRLRQRLLRCLQQRARREEAGSEFLSGAGGLPSGKRARAKENAVRPLRGAHRVHFSWSGKLMLLILTRKPPLVYATRGQFPLFELRSDGWWNLVTLKAGCFLFDDRHIAIGSEDKRVHVWRLPDVIDFEAHAIHHRTTILYSAYTLSGHLSIVNCCASTPPIGVGRSFPVLATCGIERMVRLWTLGKRADGISDDCLFYPPDDKYVTPESLESMDVISHFNRLAGLHRRRFGLGMDSDDSDEGEGEDDSDPSLLLGGSGDEDEEGPEDGEEDEGSEGEGSRLSHLRGLRRRAGDQRGDDRESATSANTDEDDTGESNGPASGSYTTSHSGNSESAPRRARRVRRATEDTEARTQEGNISRGTATEVAHSSDDNMRRNTADRCHADSPTPAEAHAYLHIERTEERRGNQDDECDTGGASESQSVGGDVPTGGVRGHQRRVAEGRQRAVDSGGSHATTERLESRRERRGQRLRGSGDDERQSSAGEPVGIFVRYTVPRRDDFLL
uniref:WD domain, G-beta repeat-containing protein n=1 Tax=Neospora caninum (strain Liverpool) TaxID=572307 RepID=A0A0F7U401_NEOCL|nr:TPA: WD domain, G-beta repeat-containing protein [Neospora caninum Liverpool]